MAAQPKIVVVQEARIGFIMPNMKMNRLSLWGVWLLGAWLSLTACLAQSVVQAEPSVIALKRSMSRLSLDGQARVWLEPGRSATITDALAVFEQAPADAQVHLRREGKPYLLQGRALWMQFNAHNHSSAQRWLVQVALSTTDLVTLYYRRADGSWVEQSAGDSLPHSQWALRTRYPTFILSEDASKPVQYFLRIVHDRVPYSADVQIYSDETLIESSQTENLFLGGYFGITLAVIVMCLAQAFALRYANYLRYAAYVGVLGLTQIAFLGLGTQYFTRNLVAWNSMSGFVMPMLSVAAAVWLVRALVQPGQFSKLLDWWARLMISLMLCIALLEALMPSLWSFRMLNIMALVGMASIYLILWQSAKLGDKNARWIALGFLPVVLAALFPVIRNFGLVRTGFLAQYAVTLGAAIEVPMLMYAITQRSARLRDMRVREQALLQKDALTGLADERRFLNKLHNSLLRARRHRHRLGILHVNLVNHDRIYSDFGTPVANAALLLTASQLRKVGRDIDMSARLNGPNFALLIEGPVTPARMVEMATRLLAESLRPSEALPVGLQPKLRISVALLPDEQADSLAEDASTQYQWVLSRIEQIWSEDDKKAIRTLNF
jgi:two-component system, sensor histidine kinase LadS